MRRIVLGAIVLVVLGSGLIALGTLGLGPVVITREDEQKIILLLGKPRKVTEPGLDLRIPLFEDVKTYDRRLLYLNIKPAKIQTKDQERIEVDNFAIWRIADPKQFLGSFPSGMSAADIRIERAVIAAVREVIGQHTLTDVLTTARKSIQRAITERTAKTLGEVGVVIEDVRINRTELPAGAERNVYERMKTDRERLARKNRAEGEEQARRIRAEADREARVTVANARKQAEIARGEGDAEAARIYAEAYSKNPEFYAFVRSLEAYRKTIGADTTLVLSPDSEFFRFLDGRLPSRAPEGEPSP